MTSTIRKAPRRSSGARLRIDTTMPVVSFVITSNGSLAQLSACLESVVSVVPRAEVVVSRQGDIGELVELRRIAPAVIYVAASQPASRADLRSLGMSQATGDVVVFVDDDQAVDAAWLRDVQGRDRKLPAARFGTRTAL